MKKKTKCIFILCPLLLMAIIGLSYFSHDLHIKCIYETNLFESSFVSPELTSEISEIYGYKRNSRLHFNADGTIDFYYYYEDDNGNNIVYESFGTWKKKFIGWEITFDNENFCTQKVSAKIIGRDRDGFPVLALQWPITKDNGYIKYMMD